MNTSEEYRIFTVITVKSSGPFYSVYVVYADIYDIGSRNVERIESAVKAMDVKLEHYEWYEIYAASGQQQIR